MTHSTFRFSFEDLRLDVRQIENVIGYGEGESHEHFADMITEVLSEAEKKCRIKAEYCVFPISNFDSKNKSIEINGIVFNLHKIVFGQLARSESVAVFLCTAGEWIGQRSKQSMKEGDMLKGYLYDIIGSEIADIAADLMQDNLKATVSLAFKKNITNRYSPGYCDWDVSEQHKLFRLLPDNFCGIKLTPSALMDPIKSVSGFIGIGEHVKYNLYTCNLCDMKDCIYRKLRGIKQH
jgi:hypothetical protein